MAVSGVSASPGHFGGIRQSTSIALSRKIALVQQARVASVAAQGSSVSSILQPSTSTSEQATTLIRQVSTTSAPLKSSSHLLKSEESSEDMCSDKSQLVRKANSLPMQVT